MNAGKFHWMFSKLLGILDSNTTVELVVTSDIVPIKIVLTLDLLTLENFHIALRNQSVQVAIIYGLTHFRIGLYWHSSVGAKLGLTFVRFCLPIPVPGKNAVFTSKKMVDADTLNALSVNMNSVGNVWENFLLININLRLTTIFVSVQRYFCFCFLQRYS